MLSAGEGASLEVGDGVYIGPDCELDAAPRIRIGARTSLQSRSQILGEVSFGAGCACAANLYVSSAWHRFADEPHLPIRVQDFLARQMIDRRAVTVGDDCWFGINVVLLPGVTVGRGCVVGANSVVRADLPPYSIAVGAPARIVKTRLHFDPPASIDASFDEHVPYFYAGLRQLAGDESGDDGCPRVRGGWPAEPFFSIAVATTDGGTVELEVDTLCAGRLLHGGSQVELVAGRQRLSFIARLGRFGVLDFGWEPVDAQCTDALVLLGASAREAV
jgi:acetyltransferase-like isoleucine patch superfamily enzyme